MLLQVKRNQEISSNYYLLKFEANSNLTQAQPGQFIHLKIKTGFEPLLRRPFSIHDLNNGELSILYRVVGKGTRLLSKVKAGEKLDVLGPLGQGFSLPVKTEMLIIGGGMGIAPLYYLTKRLLVEKDNNIQVFIGGNTGRELSYFIDKFKTLNLRYEVASLDGSTGYMGTVIDLWRVRKVRPDYIFGCGPVNMLKSLKLIADRKKIPGEISIEKRMACGIGICLSCAQKTTQGNRRVCKEGPVFSLKEVVFND